MNKNMETTIWTILYLMTATASIQTVASVYVGPYDIMKCSYGERGSLTAICVNATATFFKSTPYRFDQLDETLKCVNCSLKTIDTGTLDISGNQIRNLDLSGSQIEIIRQKGFLGLIFLENLILSRNSIRSIYPGTFTGVKKIKYIDLSDNQINILSDDGFLELVNLEKLNLEHNIIQTISAKAFNGLTKVKEINLRFNQMTEIKNIFDNLTSLEILNLERNHIQSLTGSDFYNLTSLLEINLSYNKLVSPVIEFNPQSNLKNLYLQNNFIDNIAPQFLKGLHKLENLDLSNNQISQVNQQTLQALYSLRNLNISYNKLSKFRTGTYSGLPQLELLNVSHNHIEDIEITGVFSIHSLHALDLSYNVISDLDYVGLISRLPRLSYLKLEDNKLHCDLEDEMVAYFAEDNFKFVLFDNSIGAVKCIDTPSKKLANELPDAFVKEAGVVSGGSSGAEIAIFVLISIVFVCIGFLFFLQYRSYRDMMYTRSPNRATSTVHLMSSNMEPSRESDDYLKE